MATLHASAQATDPSSLMLAPRPALQNAMRVTPDVVPPDDTLGKSIDVTLAPNEYEPTSFVIRSPKAQHQVTVRVGWLQGPDHALAPSAVDVRWVKCWYQAGGSFTNRDINRSKAPPGETLLPELLLKDPALVGVDVKAKKNILRRDLKPGQTYVDHAYPDDAKTLQPIAELPADFTQQVWLTVNVPDDTPPGRYDGYVEVLTKETTARLPLHVTVLPFALQPTPLEYGWYVNSHWGGFNQARAKAAMRDLVAHGVRLVGLIEHLKDLDWVVRAMRQAGLETDRLFISQGSVTHGHPWYINTKSSAFGHTAAQVTQQRAAAWVAAAHRAGAGEVYLYLQDEAKGEDLKGQAPYAAAIHRAGAKTWAANNRAYFASAGSFIDMIVMDGPPKPIANPPYDLVRKIHKIGGKIYCYNNPQGGEELPETYRGRYGIQLWQAGYDGAFDWAWWWPFGGDPWNDFDHKTWRDHNMVYPTRTGIVDTIQWEGFREGVDDNRYVATLQWWIKQTQQIAGKNAAADSAAQWLARLKDYKVPLADLGDVRHRIITHILACQHAIDQSEQIK